MRVLACVKWLCNGRDQRQDRSRGLAAGAAGCIIGGMYLLPAECGSSGLVPQISTAVPVRMAPGRLTLVLPGTPSVVREMGGAAWLRNYISGTAELVWLPVGAANAKAPIPRPVRLGHATCNMQHAR